MSADDLDALAGHHPTNLGLGLGVAAVGAVGAVLAAFAAGRRP